MCICCGFKKKCPQFEEGSEQGVLETPDHLLSSCSGYRDLRVGLNLKDALEDRAAFLRPGIKARRQVEYDTVLGSSLRTVMNQHRECYFSIRNGKTQNK